VYEKILRALRGVTPEDEDEGITVVADWIVERIRATGTRPVRVTVGAPARRRRVTQD